MGTLDVECEPAKGATGVRRQVEYYFSDSNLPRDRFLRGKIDENEQGWVDIAVLLTFNKLKELGATRESVCDAVAPSEYLETDPTRERIRRTTPLPETTLWRSRSIYAKGWNATHPEPSVQDIQTLFAPYGKVLSVRIRRWTAEDGARHFKGSIFVEFASPEAAERAVSDTHTIKVRESDEDSAALVDKELIVMNVEAYFNMKREETRERLRRSKERKAVLKEAQTGNGGVGAKDKDRNKKPQQNGSQSVKREYLKGLIMRFEGVGGTTSREDLKDVIEAHGNIAWIDFERGSSDGYIRFTTEGTAQSVSGALTEGKVEICGALPKYSALEGEAEAAYWMKIWDEQDRAKNVKKRLRSDRDGHGRHGYQKKFRGGGRGGSRARGARD